MNETLRGREPSFEEWEVRRVYESYLRDFQLSERDLANKKILDVGSDSTPWFLKYCLDHNITDSIVALDNRRYLENARGSTKKIFDASGTRSRYVQSNAAEMPFKENSFDLILARAIIYALDPDDILYMILEVLYAAKEKGEIRIAPVLRNDENYIRTKRYLQNVLAPFVHNGKVAAIFLPGERIIFNGKEDYRDLLVIKKESPRK